jgi:membrane-bound metal-dependent hydrolase YbcI (DUF457 family)
MKRFTALFFASVIIALIVFAIFYWAVGFNYQESLITGFAGFCSGFVAELLKPYLVPKKKTEGQ